MSEAAFPLDPTSGWLGICLLCHCVCLIAFDAFASTHVSRETERIENLRLSKLQLLYASVSETNSYKKACVMYK